MTQQALILIWRGGEYEDKFSIPLAVSFDQKALEEIRDKHLARRKNIATWGKRLYDFCKEYAESTPLPEYEKLEPIKKFPPTMAQITPEMRKEREEATARNKIKFEANEKLEDAYIEKFAQEKRIFMSSILVPEEDMKSVLNWDWSSSFDRISVDDYEIETIDFIEP